MAVVGEMRRAAGVADCRDAAVVGDRCARYAEAWRAARRRRSGPRHRSAVAFVTSVASAAAHGPDPADDHVRAFVHGLRDLGLVERRLPSVGFARAGMLLSHESDDRETLRRAAAFVKKILDGARAGELPFEQPTKFDLTVNLKTAKALGITLPRALRSSALTVDE